ncbi:MAG TPA: acyltransferase [Pyrinomonadaceae bacterium]|nr:acyltransferase [Pyrinomonadaceae bacterium]
MSAETVSIAPVQTAGRPRTGAADFRLGHRRSLDGVRGVAVLAVLAVHTHHLGGARLLPGGSLGVDIFFVLSGFLITGLLIEEWSRSGAISLLDFYRRRALRLVPALALLLLTLACVSRLALTPQEAEQTVRAIPVAFLYMTDFVVSLDGRAALGALKHTWSLAVEEQFYLLWPLLLLAALRARLSVRAIALLTLALAIFVALHRSMLWQGGAPVTRTYYGADTRADALLIGCVAAMALYWNLAAPVGRGVASAAAAVLALLLLCTDYATPAMHLGGFSLAAAAAALVILRAVAAPSALTRVVLEAGPLVWAGRVSYGLYLWHYPVFKAVARWGAPGPLKLTVALGVTFAVTAASFYLVERPALRLKGRYARAR